MGSLPCCDLSNEETELTKWIAYQYSRIYVDSSHDELILNPLHPSLSNPSKFSFRPILRGFILGLIQLNDIYQFIIFLKNYLEVLMQQEVHSSSDSDNSSLLVEMWGPQLMFPEE